jgi:hypothetical protein
MVNLPEIGRLPGNRRSIAPRTPVSVKSRKVREISPDRRRPQTLIVWVYLMIGSGVLSVVALSEKDAVAQESKACSSVHLPLEELRFRVHAFGAPVVVLEGDRCGDGVGVLVDSSGEGVQADGRTGDVPDLRAGDTVHFCLKTKPCTPA